MPEATCLKEGSVTVTDIEFHFQKLRDTQKTL